MHTTIFPDCQNQPQIWEYNLCKILGLDAIIMNYLIFLLLIPKHPREPKWLFANLGRLLCLQFDCGALETL